VNETPKESVVRRAANLVVEGRNQGRDKPGGTRPGRHPDVSLCAAGRRRDDSAVDIVLVVV
jgi:hypothetical protein